MTKSIILGLFISLSLSLSGQFQITGKVLGEQGVSLVGATVLLDNTIQGLVTNNAGEFSFSKLKAGTYHLQVHYLGYEPYARLITLNGQDMNLVIDMKLAYINAQEVLVTAYRATHRDPIAYTEMTKQELEKINLGMDVPELLNTVPSLYFTSDAGNGVGYTYLRLRGADQTNINVSINGVPLNDAESHGVFWVDLPDLMASTDNVQIQRGVGTSANGAGAFGGSINLLTQKVDTSAHASLNVGLGSFNTNKVSLGFGTGLLNEHWNMDGRFSRISSDGYIDRSQSDLQSFFFSGGFQNEKTSLKAMVFGGDEVTHQAWYGVPRARIENDVEGMEAFAADNGWSEENVQNLLNSDRSFNYYTYDNEVDDYGQDYYQLHASQKLNNNWSLQGALFYTKGKGYFEQYQDMSNAYDDTGFSDYGLANPIIGGDTISQANFIRRRWLDNDFYGVIASGVYEKGSWKTVIGAGLNTYDGAHFGEVLWASVAGDSEVRDRYYDNTAKKDDRNGYIKTNYRINEKLDAYVDLQGRQIDYTFFGNLADGSMADQSVSYSFFNPKAGLSFVPTEKQRIFISYGIANKEPNRDDLTSSTVNSRPQHQTLNDLELGYSYRSQRIALEAVLYNMQYKDQLINTGEINDVGENVRTNVANSYRRGVELIFTTQPIESLLWNANVGFSENIIQNHVEYVADYADYSSVKQEFGDVEIAYAPSLILSNSITYQLINPSNSRKGNRLDLTLLSKFVDEQQLDNTGNASRTIDSFFVNDIRLDFTLRPKGMNRLLFTFLLRNVLDEEYESNGWTYRYLYGGEETSFDALFPQAGINFMSGLTLEF